MLTKKALALATAAGMAVMVATTGGVLAQTTPSPTRGEIGSARNIQHVDNMLSRLVNQLQRDQRDYGGYRVKAIGEMQQAKRDLDLALQWDATHPH